MQPQDDELKLLSLLRDITSHRGFRTLGEVAYFTGVTDSRAKKSLDLLVADGRLVALKGSEIPWGFLGKRDVSTYYASSEYLAERKEEIRLAAEQAREEDADSAACLVAYEALAAEHPEEFDRLYSAERDRLAAHFVAEPMSSGDNPRGDDWWCVVGLDGYGVRNLAHFPGPGRPIHGTKTEAFAAAAGLNADRIDDSLTAAETTEAS